MTTQSPNEIAQIWRGEFLEASHPGDIAIYHAEAGPIFEWGDVTRDVLPRSSAKMIQALSLVESGAAAEHGLTSEHLALACASHEGAAIHLSRVNDWLTQLDFKESDLRCGSHIPVDKETRKSLNRGEQELSQVHNNCSGKHTGFLTTTRRIGGGAEYIEADHPLQIAIRDAFEDVTGAPSPGWAIDGCSAPNFASTTANMAHAMARFAVQDGTGKRPEAMALLVDAMRKHPELVANEGADCTELMRACGGRVAIKGGAEGFNVAIIPDLKLGLALKAADGATRASVAAMAAVLVALGQAEASHPAIAARYDGPINNARGIPAARVTAAPALKLALSKIRL